MDNLGRDLNAIPLMIEGHEASEPVPDEDVAAEPVGHVTVLQAQGLDTSTRLPAFNVSELEKSDRGRSWRAVGSARQLSGSTLQSSSPTSSEHSTPLVASLCLLRSGLSSH